MSTYGYSRLHLKDHNNMHAIIWLPGRSGIQQSPIERALRIPRMLCSANRTVACSFMVTQGESVHYLLPSLTSAAIYSFAPRSTDEMQNLLMIIERFCASMDTHCLSGVKYLFSFILLRINQLDSGDCNQILEWFFCSRKLDMNFACSL